MEFLRWAALGILLLFSGYTIYVAKTESFWKSLRTVIALKWGKQVVMDLYVGLFLFGFFIYLVEGSLLVTLAWLVPALILGNPVTLLYFVVSFPAIMSHFA